MMNRETALGLLNYAAAYICAAEHLVKARLNNELRLRFDAPIELLVGHGFELLLKSYLREKGVQNNDLIIVFHLASEHMTAEVSPYSGPDVLICCSAL